VQHQCRFFNHSVFSVLELWFTTSEQFWLYKNFIHYRAVIHNPCWYVNWRSSWCCQLENH